jgi:hypothetical protein
MHSFLKMFKEDLSFMMIEVDIVELCEDIKGVLVVKFREVFVAELLVDFDGFLLVQLLEIMLLVLHGFD